MGPATTAWPQHRMQLLLLRHGIAEERQGGEDDPRRALTAQGRRRTLAVCERLRCLGWQADACRSSPFVRARQTAELAQASGLVPHVRLSPLLAPEGAVLPALANWLAALAEESGAAGGSRTERRQPDTAAPHSGTLRRPPRLLLVGHEPDLSSLACRLLGCPDERLALRKAGLAVLELPPQQDLDLQGRARLLLLLTPRLLLG